eukprot:gene28800-34766_t
MILLLKSFSAEKFSPVHCVLAQTDNTTYDKVLTHDISVLRNAQWHRVVRSREVKQSYITSVFTTLLSIPHSLYLIAQIQPQVIICNGPGTCVPLCYMAFLLSFLGVMQHCPILYVESFCRVQHLSLTGKLLYPIADRFIVQWEDLAEKYSRAEYLGDL